MDVSPFINHLPTGSNTSRFSTQNASGSTSQAASIIEALGARSPLLLIDEDTSATNLMIRDERMRELVDPIGVPTTLVVAAIDERLNEVGYIVPGLGDAGDRLYGLAE